MTDLIDYIDEQISFCIDSVTFFGLCHLLTDDNGVYPATVGAEATKVTPNDNSPILIYHRLLNGQYEPREDLSFGRKITAQNNQRIRTVVFIDIGVDQSVIDDIINALPDMFEIEGYKYLNVSSTVDLIRDRTAIWQEEFSEAYRSRFQMRYHIYAIEYNLEYIKCPVCETSP